ncbi:MAG TPA: beta-ketoacyl-[acyl-carrier-protein] synthase family protein [Crocinitomicaceae bacterium]|nr:beta-ketoacyl-[acyl-carrier-protein] synthase family protein [Crocinitomicaceae bacterium]
MKIYITGYGLISAIGVGEKETLDALKNERSGIATGKKEETKAYKVGEIALSNEELKTKYKLRTDGSRTALLGMVAAKQAFEGHLISDEIKTGLISGTSVGGMDISEQEYRNYLNNENHNPENYKHHSSGVSSDQIAEELGINDFINTISTACSSAANALMMGARMIRSGMLDRVVVGGTDSLTSFTISGFKSLMIFDADWCKPFDNSRKGLNLGEGAGYIVLESEKSLAITKKQPVAQLTGWSNASDAFHQTASSPDGQGAQLSMLEALKVAGLKPTDIDYINAHGTATPNNDLSESQAIKSVFKEVIPPFSSTKAFTGHTLAASGGIEAVFAILAINNGLLYPNLNFSEVIEETQLTPQLSFEEGKTVKHVLSNSFGFGGNNSTVILSRVD